MPAFFDRLKPLAEFFLLRGAERTTRGYTDRQRAGVETHVAAAGRRLAAGRRVVHAIPAALLLREAVRQYLLALEAAKDPRGDLAAIDARDFAGRLPPLPDNPLASDAALTDDARVRAALWSTDPLYFDRLSAEDAAHARAGLERAASMLERRVEARSPTHVVATRWGRLAAVVLVAAYAATVWLHAKLWPKNIALDKHVRVSSQGGGGDGHELVDGEISAVPGIRTNTEDSPNAVIDLGKEYRIARVAVYNRVDGWFDDCLPLALEFSTDGAKYKEIARRDQHFGADPPWVVDGLREVARYVRVRLARRGYLALSEVEVFGREVEGH